MHALGSIEVVGLVAGVEAADVACKTADVNLIGYELARGGGYVTVKVEGQVAAVQAAMAAAEVAASKLTRVVSRIVIPRPHQELESIVFSAATVGLTKPAPGTKATTKSAAKAKAPEETKPASEAEAGQTEKPGPTPDPKAITKPAPKPQLEQTRPESGPDQKPAPEPEPKPGAAPKNPAETTKAPRTSTTRRKQS